MIEDYHVWVRWFSDWRWWNFLMVFGGLAGAMWSSAPLWMRLFPQRVKNNGGFSISILPLKFRWKWVFCIMAAVLIILFLNWYPKRENPVWIWAHPDSAADAESVKNTCQLKAYESIDSADHPLMVGQISQERARYVNICMQNHGFTLRRLDR